MKGVKYMYDLAICTFLHPQVLLVEKKMSEVHECLTMAGQLIEVYHGSPVQKESLKVFFLVLQVCHYLMAGQVGVSLASCYYVNNGFTRAFTKEHVKDSFNWNFHS